MSFIDINHIKENRAISEKLQKMQENISMRKQAKPKKSLIVSSGQRQMAPVMDNRFYYNEWKQTGSKVLIDVINSFTYNDPSLKEKFLRSRDFNHGLNNSILYQLQITNDMLGLLLTTGSILAEHKFAPLMEQKTPITEISV